MPGHAFRCRKFGMSLPMIVTWRADIENRTIYHYTMNG